MTHFTILRFEKLKSRRAVSGSSGHMMRSHPTLNAHSDRTAHNQILVGSSDPVADVDSRLAGAVTRKNSVLAIELLVTASPEWFTQASKSEKLDWVRSSKAWLVQHFGAENLVHLQLHVDEATPHLTGFIVPRDTSGRLNAARWLDGSKKLADMQTAYTAAVAHLGLERGIEGSTAKHASPRTMRGLADAGDVDDPVVAKKLARRALHAERRLSEMQDTAVAMRETVNAVRDIALPDMAESLGLSRDRKDPTAWVDAEREHKITLQGTKWYDHKHAQGGGGAIDLAMHVLRTGFRETVAWLGLELGAKPTERAVAARTLARAPQEVASAMREAEPFLPPVRTPGALSRVLKYLQGRGLRLDVLNQLEAQGRLYGDERGNAVFLTMDAKGRPRGAELRGTGPTPFHGHAKGSTRALPWFFDTCKEPKRLVLCESAIDALSYHQVTDCDDARIASTGGAKPEVPSAVATAIRAGSWEQVVVAYDNDQVGNRMAEAITEELHALGAQVTRHAPQAKDWNEELMHGASFSFSKQNLPVAVRQPDSGQPFSDHLPPPSNAVPFDVP